MDGARPELLTFKETYFERIWGGRRLHDTLARTVPPDKVIGEAWLIADHDECQSVVDSGPWAGRTLGELMAECPEYLLGPLVKPTPRGQFPLLLKLIDSGEALSVQVHPDDETARRLNEPDVGKTEMWYVLEADPGAELISGLVPGTTRESFAAAVAEGRVEQCMARCPAQPGTSVFVSAGTVHAIGGGILLAEIQQNSNITYRVHDWNRVDACGKPRQLHLDKAMEAIEFGPVEPEPAQRQVSGDNNHRILSACPYFVTEVVEITRSWEWLKGREHFHILVALDAGMTVLAGDSYVRLARGGAVLVPGQVGEYRVEGSGQILLYTVLSPSHPLQPR